MEFLIVVALAFFVIYHLDKSGKGSKTKQARRKTSPRTRDDAEEAYDRHQLPGKSSRKPTLRIKYCDSEGNVTTRDIAPYKRSLKDRFYAHCFLRGEKREFLFERVITSIDLSTGEQLTPTQLYHRIRPHNIAPMGLLDSQGDVPKMSPTDT